MTKWILTLLLVTVAVFQACSDLSNTSYIAIFRGKVVTGSTPVDTTISIYGTSRGRPIFRDGAIRSELRPGHPDTVGYFILSGTSPEYGSQEEPPSYWKSAPIEIFVTHKAFKDFHDTLSEAELKTFSQITPEQAGIKLDKIEKGVWILPDVTLQPK